MKMAPPHRDNVALLTFHPNTPENGNDWKRLKKAWSTAKGETTKCVKKYSIFLKNDTWDSDLAEGTDAQKQMILRLNQAKVHFDKSTKGLENACNLLIDFMSENVDETNVDQVEALETISTTLLEVQNEYLNMMTNSM